MSNKKSLVLMMLFIANGHIGLGAMENYELGNAKVKAKQKFVLFLKEIKNDPDFFNRLSIKAQQEFVLMFNESILNKPFGWTSKNIMQDYKRLQYELGTQMQDINKKRDASEFLKRYPGYVLRGIAKANMSGKQSRATLPIQKQDYFMYMYFYQLALWTNGAALVHLLEQAGNIELARVVLQGLLDPSLMVKESVFGIVKQELEMRPYDKTSMDLIDLILTCVKEIRNELDRMKYWEKMDYASRLELAEEGEFPPEEDV
jgi:hypothetical protein